MPMMIFLDKFKWRGKIHAKYGWYQHGLDPGLNRKKKTTWTPAFTFLCLLITDTMSPGTSSFCHKAFLVTLKHERKQSPPSSSSLLSTIVSLWWENNEYTILYYKQLLMISNNYKHARKKENITHHWKIYSQ